MFCEHEAKDLIKVSLYQLDFFNSGQLFQQKSCFRIFRKYFVTSTSIHVELVAHIYKDKVRRHRCSIDTK